MRIGGRKFRIKASKSILKNNGIKFVTHLKMSDTRRRSTIYYLIHASNNLRTVELMKETMRNINPDFTYFGPDNKKLGREQS